MITLTLNGEELQLEDNTNIVQLLQKLNLENKRLAVEINQQIVSRSDFNHHILQNQDKVEIVQAIGGGCNNQKY
ncbi:MAG: thiamine biosynthesis protein ThiS [Gammaproteobacteria bacterium]|nr:MAG: thiamine biosynthesis protein ThiS [Gammaproteobacteria bacterium]